MNNDQRNDLEESKDVDVNLTIPQARDSSHEDRDSKQEPSASAPLPDATSENEYLEEDGTHKTREHQEDGEEDND